jgi:hypothetical protein
MIFLAKKGWKSYYCQKFLSKRAEKRARSELNEALKKWKKSENEKGI